MTSPTKKLQSRGLIIIIVAMAGVVGYVFGVFLPGQKAIAAKRKQLQEKQRFISATGIRTAAAASLQESLKSATKHIEEWRQRTSTDSVTMNLLGDLPAIAAETGISLHRMTPQEVDSLETLKRQTLDVEVEGGFAEIVQFLHRIEQRPETIWVPSLSMQSVPENRPNVQCTLSLVVFADNREKSG